MKKWICKVCGYTHQGEEAPEKCPKCGAPRAEFHEKKKSKGCVCLLMFCGLIAVCSFNLWSCSSKTTVNNSVIQQEFELTRYLGRWYEVARFDHSFERGLTHCTALYTMKRDGKVRIMNQGKKHGKWRTSEGKAKTTDTPGLLRVSFFGPFYTDYRILLLAPNYSYALVGSSSDKYLWILSRTKHLKPTDCDAILKEAQTRGYDTNKLIWVEQR